MTQRISAWAKAAGIPRSRILQRLQRGLTPKAAVWLAPLGAHTAPIENGHVAFTAKVRTIGHRGQCVSVPAAIMRGLRKAAMLSNQLEVSIPGCQPFRTRILRGTRGARIYLPKHACGKLRTGQSVTVELRTLRPDHAGTVPR